jgi:hypothetical protein
MRNFSVGGEVYRTGVSRATVFQGWRPDGWWTEQRLAKLRYLMETYDDADKAGRVLGASGGCCARKWNWIKAKERKK